MSFWVAGAVVGGSLVSGVLGSNASKSAANAQAQASQQSIAEQQREYNQTRSDFQPYRQAGDQALGQLNQLNNGNYSSFYKSPSYNFQRAEGTRNITNSFGAQGGAFSGNALRALTQYSSNLAASDFGNYYNRIAGVAGMGMGATGQTSAAGQNAAGNISNSLMAGGDARASGIMGGANAWGGAINSGLNTGLLYRGGYFNNPNQSGVGSGSGAAGSSSNPYGGWA